MKPIKGIVLATLVVALFVWACASAPKEKAAETPAQAEKAIAKDAFLVGAHIKKQVNCEGCHGTGGNVVDDNEQPVNMNCVKCHGALDEVAKKWEDLIKQNPLNFPYAE